MASLLDLQPADLIRDAERELDNLVDQLPELDALRERFTGLARGFDLGQFLPGELPSPLRNPGAELRGLAENLDIGGLEGLVDRLPPGLRGPDATGEVPTGLSTIGRAEAELGATLSAVPRITLAFAEQGVTQVNTPEREFVVVRLYDDPATGLTGVHLRALDGGEDVFAFDGLEVGSRADALAAIDLGRPQVASPVFAEMVADARDAALLEGRTLLVTGPSLGGALAQAAAYEMAEALAASGQPVAPGTVRLVTVDALGGREAAESLNGGRLDPGVLALIDALNLRTEGDLVSRIGSHIGPTISFAPVDAQGQPVTLTTAEAHVNVESLLATLRSDALFAAGVRGAPAEVSGFAALSNNAAGPVVEALRAQGFADDPDREIPLQIPGTATLSPDGRVWSLDANEDGAPDIAIALATPATETPSTGLGGAADLVFG